MLSGKNIKTYDNIWKIVTGQEDDYTIDCLLDYSYFKKQCDSSRFKQTISTW